jgi:hypothetical protein
MEYQVGDPANLAQDIVSQGISFSANQISGICTTTSLKTWSLHLGSCPTF